MRVNEMKELVKEAISYTDSASSLFGETMRGDAALIASQIAIAKALTVIAASMVENMVQVEFRAEVDEMRQERSNR